MNPLRLFSGRVWLPVTLTLSAGMLAIGTIETLEANAVAKQLRQSSLAAVEELSPRSLAEVRRLVLSDAPHAAISKASQLLSEPQTPKHVKCAACVYAAFASAAVSDSDKARFWHQESLKHVGEDRTLPLLISGLIRSADGVRRPVKDQEVEAFVSTERDAVFRMAAFQNMVSSRPAAVTLSDVFDELEQARQNMKPGASLSARIRFMSWRFLYSELASHDGRSTTAFEGLAEGTRLLNNIESEIQVDQGIDQLLDQDAVAVMLLDAVRLRVPQLISFQNAAIQTEHKRLEVLRKLVEQYRHATGRVAAAAVGFLVDDTGAGDSIDASIKSLEAINQLIDQHRQEHGDDWLLGGEPQDVAYDESLRNKAPFTSNLFSQIHSVAAVAELNRGDDALAASRTADTIESRRELLQTAMDTYSKALAWAELALDSQVVGAGDPENVIAEYVHAAASEGQGLSLTSLDPADGVARREAGPLFEVARASFRKAGELIRRRQTDLQASRSARVGPDLAVATNNLHLDFLALDEDVPAAGATSLARDVEKRITKYDISAGLDQATQQTLAGRPGDAARTLRTLIETLTEADQTKLGAGLWLRWIESLRRDGASPFRLLALLEDARTGGVFETGDGESSLLEVRIRIDRLQQELVASNGKSRSEQVVERLHTEIVNVRKLVETAKPALATETIQAARFEVCQSLLASLSEFIVPDSRSAPQSIGASREYDRAIDSGEKLSQKLAAASASPGSVHPLDEIGYRESYIDSLLARGYLAAQITTTYQPETEAAFHLAIDQRLRLPWESKGFTLLGSPLLNAILNRPDNAGLLQTARERTLRRATERFVDASFALAFGRPADAAGFLQSGRNLATKADVVTESEGRPLLAAELLPALSERSRGNLAGAFDSYRLLALSETGRTEEALRAAASLLLPGEPPESGDMQLFDSLNVATIDAAVRDVRDLMLAYGLARTFEQHGVTQAGSNDVRNTVMLELAQTALRQAETLLTDSARERYIGFSAMLAEMRQRLTQPDFYLENARRYRQHGQLDLAIATLDDGLMRHRTVTTLWLERVELGFHVAALGPPDQRNGDRTISGLAALLTRMHSQIAEIAETAYWDGRLHELNQNPAASKKHYARSRELSTPGSRIHRLAEAGSGRVTVNQLADRGAP